MWMSITFACHDVWSAFMAFPAIKTTPVKKVPNSKVSLSCCLYDANVVCNGRYYSLLSENAKKTENLRKKNGQVTQLF